jgi:hypothetical protein
MTTIWMNTVATLTSERWKSVAPCCAIVEDHRHCEPGVQQRQEALGWIVGRVSDRANSRMSPRTMASGLKLVDRAQAVNRAGIGLVSAQSPGASWHTK